MLVNKPKVQPYRAQGAGNAAHGVESVIDELAERCGVDPLDFRIRNAVKEGSPSVAGPAFKRIGYTRLLTNHGNMALEFKAGVDQPCQLILLKLSTPLVPEEMYGSLPGDSFAAQSRPIPVKKPAKHR